MTFYIIYYILYNLLHSIIGSSSCYGSAYFTINSSKTLNDVYNTYCMDNRVTLLCYYGEEPGVCGLF